MGFPAGISNPVKATTEALRGGGKASRGHRLTNNDAALNYVLDRVSIDSERAARRPFDEAWFGDLAYLFGASHITPEHGWLRPPRNLKRRRDSYQANLILPKVMRALGKMYGVQGTFRVAPNSGSREDRHAAAMAEDALDHAKQVTKFQKMRNRALYWAAICGSGFLMPVWNPRGGTKERVILREDEDYPDIRAEFDNAQRQQRIRDGRYEDTYVGELELKLVEPFQFWPDPQARGGGIEECAWAATNMAVPLEEIYDRFGVEVQSDASELRGSEVYREIFAQLASPVQGTEIARRHRTDHLARVIEYFERPSRSNGERGRHIVIAGGKVVTNDENPYVATGSPLPFVKYDWFPPEGRFWGMGLVEQLRGPNRARNQARTHAISFMKRLGYSPTYIPRGSGAKVTNIQQLQGLVVEYNASYGEPRHAPAPVMPEYIARNADIAEAEMDKIAAQSSPGSKGFPGQMRGSMGLKAMQAENDLVLTPTTEGMLNSDTEVGIRQLQMISVFYDRERVMKSATRSRHLDVRHFLGADLRGHTDVTLLSQPGRLDSIETRQSTVMDALEVGGLDMQRPEDKVLFYKTMAFNGSEEFVEAMIQQDEAEGREIQRIIDEPGYARPVEPWNDPDIRAKTLERYMNSPEWDTLADDMKERIVMRWQGFSEMMQARIDNMLKMQAQQNGVPKQPGEASQPRRSA